MCFSVLGLCVAAMHSLHVSRHARIKRKLALSNTKLACEVLLADLDDLSSYQSNNKSCDSCVMAKGETEVKLGKNRLGAMILYYTI